MQNPALRKYTLKHMPQAKRGYCKEEHRRGTPSKCNHSPSSPLPVHWPSVWLLEVVATPGHGHSSTPTVVILLVHIGPARWAIDIDDRAIQSCPGTRAFSVSAAVILGLSANSVAGRSSTLFIEIVWIWNDPWQRSGMVAAEITVGSTEVVPSHSAEGGTALTSCVAGLPVLVDLWRRNLHGSSLHAIHRNGPGSGTRICTTGSSSHQVWSSKA